MKNIHLLAQAPTTLELTQPNPSPTHPPLPAPSRETIRHILLGTPEAIRQTIHHLHTLNYADSLLWTPILTITTPVILTPDRGEAMSLLRKQL